MATYLTEWQWGLNVIILIKSSIKATIRARYTFTSWALEAPPPCCLSPSQRPPVLIPTTPPCPGRLRTRLPGKEEHGGHTAEFGLCIGRLSHIPKLHLHQCVSEGRLQHPTPSRRCLPGHLPLLPMPLSPRRGPSALSGEMVGVLIPRV